MADTFTNATGGAGALGNFIPEIWANSALEVLRNQIVAARLITKDTDITGSFSVGDVLNIPVPGTFMIEPTESETLVELDRFCDAMISIHGEMQAVVTGESDKVNNPLKHAPHTAKVVTADDWTRPYSRQTAAFPSAWVRQSKFWPAVGRVDNVYGDRNLICSCVGMEAYAAQSAAS